MLNIKFLLLAVSSVIVLCGCHYINNNAGPADQNPVRPNKQAECLPSETKVSIPPATQIDEPNGLTTLRDAIAYALVNNPELNAFSLDIRAAEARILQASLLPNPEIEVEVEEFGGTGERAGFDSSETSIQLGQLIELTSKRSKRTHLATLERDLVEWDYQSKRFDVMSEVTKAFIDVLTAQEQLNLTKELIHLSEQAYSAVAQRVKAGKDSPVEESKAKVALSNIRIELERTSEELASARHRLAAAWGSPNPTFKEATGRFYELSAVPSLDELAGLISQNPDVARWSVEKERRHAALVLEKAKATSDITLGGGLQYFDERDDSAFILGVSIPIPMFDRNQGNINEAVYMLAKTKEDSKAVETNTLAALAEAVTKLSSAFSETTVLKNDVLPLAQSAFDAMSQGYREGKFEYLDVLDAQRTLFEVRGKYIKALTKYHKSRADAERLIGQNLDGIKKYQKAKAK